MLPNIRSLHLLGATGTVRTATHDGREHVVVPVVALIGDSVIHAVNSPVAERIPLSALSVAPHGWNGKPVVYGHPVKNGVQISANDPTVVDAYGFGTIFKSCVQNNKLFMEAWIDPTRAEKIGAAKMLERIRKGEQIEVSVGAFVTTLDGDGEHNGLKYKATWKDITPDHLAFLGGAEEGGGSARGACSIASGCGGNRFAQQITAEELKALGSLYDTPQEAASEEAAELVKYKTMRFLCDQLGESYDAVEGLINDLIKAEKSHVQGYDEAAETEIEAAKLEALRTLCMAMYSTLNSVMSLSYVPLNNGVMGTAIGPTDPARYMSGRRNSATDLAVIQGVHDHAVTLGADCTPAMKAAAACGCQGEHMKTKIERFAALMANEHNPLKDQKVLETLDEQAFVALEVHCEKAATAKAAADKIAADFKAAQDKTAATEAALKAAAAAGPKEMTQDEFLAKNPELKALVDRTKKADADAKDALVGQLKTAQSEYTEVELTAMELTALERLARVAKVEPAPDFSGRGVAVSRNASKTEDFTPPDAYAAALKALQVN